MSNSAVITYTGRGLYQILNDGGSKAWSLNSKRVLKTEYLVCVQNRHTHSGWADPTASHQTAFLVGKISNVILVRKAKDGRPARWSIQISEYAEVNIPDMWDGARNPVSYSSLEALGIDKDSLEFHVMPDDEIEDDEFEDDEFEDDEFEEEGITIKEAKRLLAIKYDTSIESIQITISA